MKNYSEPDIRTGLKGNGIAMKFCNWFKFREGYHKKGGMNPDPDPDYTPAKPQSFKSSVVPHFNLNIPMPAGTKPPREACDKCGR